MLNTLILYTFDVEHMIWLMHVCILDCWRVETARSTCCCCCCTFLSCWCCCCYCFLALILLCSPTLSVSLRFRCIVDQLCWLSFHVPSPPGPPASVFLAIFKRTINLLPTARDPPCSISSAKELPCLTEGPLKK